MPRKRVSPFLVVFSVLTIGQLAAHFAGAQLTHEAGPIAAGPDRKSLSSLDGGQVESGSLRGHVATGTESMVQSEKAHSIWETPSGSPPLFLPAFYAYGEYFGYQRAMTVADVNGDGKPDLIFGGSEGFYCYNTVGVLLNNGDGTFQTLSCYDPGSTDVLAVAVGDMNGDGRPDIVIAGPCDSDNNCATGIIGVLLGNGDGTFQPVISNTAGIAGAGLATIAVADVNGDGKLDVVAFDGSSGTVLVLLGNGDGTLQAAQGYNPPYGQPGPSNMGGGILDSTILADVNGDGVPDIVMLSACVASNDCSSGLVGFLLGNGDGTFQSSSSPSNLLTQNTVRTDAYLSNGLAVADVNGDDIRDFVVASWGVSGDDGVVSVIIGLGGGAFLPATTLDSDGVIGLSIAVADVNADGIPDMVVLNASCPVSMSCSDSSSVAVFLGKGDGTFQSPQINTSGTYAQGPLAVIDLNGDGIPDVVAIANQTFVLLGTDGKVIRTTTSVTSSPNPSFFEQSVALIATVTPKSPSPPAGTITFKDGAKILGSALLASGTAVFNTSTLKTGTHRIKATYSGDPTYVASTSSTIMQVVMVSPTQTSLTSSMNPSGARQPVTFRAMVATSWGAGTPAGKVAFKDGATTLATKTLSGGEASYTTKKLAVGTHNITADYSGNAGFASSSATLTQVVQ